MKRRNRTEKNASFIQVSYVCCVTQIGRLINFNLLLLFIHLQQILFRPYKIPSGLEKEQFVEMVFIACASGRISVCQVELNCPYHRFLQKLYLYTVEFYTLALTRKYCTSQLLKKKN